MNIESLKDNTLIITSQSNKIKILQELNKNKKIINIKFMSLNEYKKNYTFDYDIKTIKYLMDKENIKVDNAITILDNLYYIENKKYNIEKLDYLVNIKNDLDKNNMLIYNPYFKDYISNMNIIIYNYYELDKYTLGLFNNPIFINDSINNKKLIIHEFDNIEEEVEYVFNNIVDLLVKGIDINNIKLCNIDSDYIPYLKRLSSFYNININFKKESIYGTKIVQEFISLIKDNLSREEIVKKLEIYNTSEIYGILISLLNKYVYFDDLNSVLDLIILDLKNTKEPCSKYNNIIEIINLDSKIEDNDYVFLLGFNNGSIPKLKKDEEYIVDNLKEYVNMSKTEELNLINRNNTINNLMKINNIIITYKKKTPFNVLFPSTLIDYIDCDVVEESINSYNYSDSYNKIKYTRLLDNYIKYGEYNDNLGILYNKYNKNNYLEYDNDYKNINKDSLIEYLDNKLTLSYSSIDNYYKCSFKYYLSNILKVNLYEETYMTIIGNLFHYVLRKAFEDNFDFDREYNYFCQNYEFNYKEKFFINKLKNDLLFIIDTIKEYRKNTGFTKELYEQKIELVLKDNPNITFKGFVDKIMYTKRNNEDLVSVIDYKTGNVNVNINDLKYGLSMQLPVYIYLISKSKLFSNLRITGFYLEHILDNEIKIDKKKSYFDLKKNNLKLMGYSNSDLSILECFDPEYENSNMINGLKTTKDGNLSKTSKVLSDSEINEIIKLCEKKIIEASNNILNGEFSINPKVIKGKNVACEFCDYKEICYVKESNKVYLEEEEEEGENDA